MFRIFIALISLFSTCLVPAHLSAQALSMLGAKSAAVPAPVPDVLKRDTPRSTIQTFLEACHNERYVQASLYLDLQNLSPRRRTTDGPDYAKQLADLLDRENTFDVNKLSDAPDGTPNDGLKADRDRLIPVSMDGAHLELYLQRETKPGGGAYWLVSQDSVAKLAQLTALEQETPFEKRLPAVLVSTKLLGTSVWIWLALILAAIALSALSRLLSRIFLFLLRPVTRNYTNTLHAQRLEAFVDPLRLLISISVFRAVIEFLDPSALTRDYLLKMLTLLFAFGCASLVMRIIDVVSDGIQNRLNSRERALTYSVLPLGVRLLKVLVFCAFALFTLSGWGYNTNTILAGVGVGGLAVALAAQKTIENFFGGVSVITDRPVLVGDFCQFGGQVGTVEDIGLRSTRIRTLDRTVVTIPNAQFSTMTLENYSRRDRMWFHPTIRLLKSTTSQQLQTFMAKLTELLNSDPMISIGGVPLRFTKIDDQSLNIEVFAYILTDDFDKYLEWQTKLLFEILKIGETNGITFSVPIVQNYNAIG